MIYIAYIMLFSSSTINDNDVSYVPVSFDNTAGVVIW